MSILRSEKILMCHELTSGTDSSLSVLAAAAFLSFRPHLDPETRIRILSHVSSCELNPPLRETLEFATTAAGIGRRLKFSLTDRSIRQARALARLWANRGVFVIRKQDFSPVIASRQGVPAILFAAGQRSILSSSTVAVMTSRKSRRTDDPAEWVPLLKQMVAAARARGGAIVTSYGNVPYSMVCILSHDVPTLVVCPELLPHMASAQRLACFQTTYDGMFNRERTLFLSPFSPGTQPPSAEKQGTRDRLVAALASVILAGSIRQRGTMERVLSEAASVGIEVEWFNSRRPSTSRTPRLQKQTPFPLHPPQPRTARKSSKEDPYLDFPTAEELMGRTPFLVHYTRACLGPWPGESFASYCLGLLEHLDKGYHNAFNTLCRILDEGLIRASGKLTRGGVPVVCWTECLPRELGSLVHWRRGLRRWTFEPYGIAVTKEILVGLGAQRVRYVGAKNYREATEDQAYLFQRDTSNGRGWVAEREWRVPGDVRLRDLATEQVIVLVPTHEEARLIKNRYPWRVGIVSLGDIQSKHRQATGKTIS